MAEAHRDEIAKLEALFAANPDGRIFTHLAEAYRKAGELERARETVERGLERHGEYPSAHVVLGRVLWDLGETAGAEQAFRRVLELDAENRVALRGLGDLARVTGRAAEALEHYRALLLLDPSDEEVEELARLAEEEAGAGPFADGAGAEAVEADVPAEGAETVADGSEIATGEVAIGAGEGDEATAVPGLDASDPDAPGLDESVALGLTAEAVLDELPGAADAEAVRSGADGGADEAALELPSPGEVTDPATEDEVALELPSLDEATGQVAEDDAADLDAGVLDLGVAATLLDDPEFDESPVVTETMGDLYAQQGLYERAADVYRELLDQRPGDARLEAKLAELERAMAGGAEPGDGAGLGVDANAVALTLDGFEPSSEAMSGGEVAPEDWGVESLVEGGDADVAPDAIAPLEGFEPFGGMEPGGEGGQPEPPVAGEADVADALEIDGGVVLDLDGADELEPGLADGLDTLTAAAMDEAGAAGPDLAGAVVPEASGGAADADEVSDAGAVSLRDLGAADVPETGTTGVVEPADAGALELGDADVVATDEADVLDLGAADALPVDDAGILELDDSAVVAADDAGVVETAVVESAPAEATPPAGSVEAEPQPVAGAPVDPELATPEAPLGAAEPKAEHVTLADASPSLGAASGSVGSAAPEAREGEPTIGAYFRSLLGFGGAPAHAAPASETSSASDAVDAEGALASADAVGSANVLELGMDAVVVEEEGEGDEFDRLFDGPAGVESAVGTTPAADEAGGSGAGEDDTDEDLEMFRAWLQNLKH